MGVKPYKRHGQSIYRTERWKAVRLAAKRRDGWACVSCGHRHRLEVDHIEPVKKRPDLAFELDNLQTLCAKCHASKTRIETGNNSHLDEPKREWRSFIDELKKQ